MNENHVKFYFTYNSPYAFLANTRIEKELAALDTTIEYKPVYQPRTGGGGPDMSSPRMTYLLEDIARFTEAYGLELNMGPFADTGKACRGFLFADRNLSTTLRHRRFLFTDSFLLLWKWRVG